MGDGFTIKATKVVLPKNMVTAKDMEGIGEDIEASILFNIQRQQQASGQALKRNAPKTRERKRRNGRRAMSLVDKEHRFVKGKQRSWLMTRVSDVMVIVEPATAELRNLVQWVQEAGYIGWFGINRIAKESIKKRIEKAIRKSFDKARRQSK